MDLLSDYIWRYWQVPYFWAGIKAYDMVAGKRKLEWSYYISKKRALELFPMLKPDSLKGALVYYDGKTTKGLLEWNSFS